MSRPNAAQIRLLSFLALVPGADFVDLTQFEQVRQVRSGDDLFVPSLVAQGWAEMGSRCLCCVRITEAERFVLASKA
jgi:hypothetical protein